MAPALRYFIIRPADSTSGCSDQKTLSTTTGAGSGIVVPLIPVDLLPDWVEIVGAPRKLDYQQAEGMYNFGTGPRGHETYTFRIIPEYDTHLADTHPADTHPADTRPSLSGSETDPEPWKEPMPRVQWQQSKRPGPSAASDDATEQLLPGGRDGGASAEVPRRCRYWCNYGTCRWGMACKFRHDMPTTIAGLSEVGLRDVPPWWRAYLVAACRGHYGGTSGAKAGSNPLLRPDVMAAVGEEVERARNGQPVSDAGITRLGPTVRAERMVDPTVVRAATSSIFEDGLGNFVLIVDRL